MPNINSVIDDVKPEIEVKEYAYINEELPITNRKSIDSKESVTYVKTGIKKETDGSVSWGYLIKAPEDEKPRSRVQKFKKADMSKTYYLSCALHVALSEVKYPSKVIVSTPDPEILSLINENKLEKMASSNWINKSGKEISNKDILERILSEIHRLGNNVVAVKAAARQ